MNGKSGAPPNFALLIGKRLAGKGKPPPGDGPPDGGPEGAGDEEGGGDDQQHQMQLSAMTDFIDAVHAKDPESALSAHMDLMQMSEPDGDEAGPSDEEAEPPEAESAA